MIIIASLTEQSTENSAQAAVPSQPAETLDFQYKKFNLIFPTLINCLFGITLGIAYKFWGAASDNYYDPYSSWSDHEIQRFIKYSIFVLFGVGEFILALLFPFFLKEEDIKFFLCPNWKEFNIRVICVTVVVALTVKTNYEKASYEKSQKTRDAWCFCSVIILLIETTTNFVLCRCAIRLSEHDWETSKYQMRASRKVLWVLHLYYRYKPSSYIDAAKI